VKQYIPDTTIITVDMSISSDVDIDPSQFCTPLENQTDAISTIDLVNKFYQSDDATELSNIQNRLTADLLYTFQHILQYFTMKYGQVTQYSCDFAFTYDIKTKIFSKYEFSINATFSFLLIGHGTFSAEYAINGPYSLCGCFYSKHAGYQHQYPDGSLIDANMMNFIPMDINSTYTYHYKLKAGILVDIDKNHTYHTQQ
jgi:hypothetical protein